MTTIPLRSGGPRAGPAVAGALLPGPALAWAALYGNVLAFLGPTPLVPIPTPLGQLVAQAMLPLSLVLALLANPRGIVRVNLFLTLLSVLAVVALAVSLHSDFLVGSTYRAVRLVLFVTVLWLLTPWWGRPDRPLLRAHLLCLRVVLGSVLLGAVLAPGAARSSEGRLQGAVWPIPPPQVAHYAAVLVGCTVVLWFCGAARGRTTLVTAVAGAVALVESHTRTALAGLVVALLVAGASLFASRARVRRTATVVAAVTGLAVAALGPFLLAWLSRGQSAQEASQLTGRTKVWTAVTHLQRTWVQDWFGSGLSNKSFGGLPIDSNWIATYLELGYLGVALDVALLLLLAVVALTRPRGPAQAVPLFLVAYCTVASFTETGLGDASPYLLELAVAASVLAGPALVRGDRPAVP